MAVSKRKSVSASDGSAPVLRSLFLCAVSGVAVLVFALFNVAFDSFSTPTNVFLVRTPVMIVWVVENDAWLSSSHCS